MSTEKTPPVGTVVRHKIWKGERHGTVVNVDTEYLYVQWHGTCVESDAPKAEWANELQVTDLPNPENDGLRPLVFDLGAWRPTRRDR